MNYMDMGSKALTRQVVTEPLYLKLFGKFSVYVSGQPVPERYWRSQNTKGMLAHLVMNQPVNREKLMTQFWPDCCTTRARANMCSTIRYIRLAFVFAGVQTSVVEYQQGEYTFNPQLRWKTDVHEFIDHLSQARATLDSQDRAKYYRAATAVYSGNYLEGFDYDWVTWQRNQLEADYLEALENLAKTHFNWREYSKVIDYCERILHINICWEEAHRILMQTQVALGERSQAIRQFQLVRAVLAKELGVQPARATLQLYEEIIQKY